MSIMLGVYWHKLKISKLMWKTQCNRNCRQGRGQQNYKSLGCGKELPCNEKETDGKDSLKAKA